MSMPAECASTSRCSASRNEPATFSRRAPSTASSVRELKYPEHEPVGDALHERRGIADGVDRFSAASSVSPTRYSTLISVLTL